MNTFRLLVDHPYRRALCEASSVHLKAPHTWVTVLFTLQYFLILARQYCSVVSTRRFVGNLLQCGVYTKICREFIAMWCVNEDL